MTLVRNFHNALTTYYILYTLKWIPDLLRKISKRSIRWRQMKIIFKYIGIWILCAVTGIDGWQSVLLAGRKEKAPRTVLRSFTSYGTYSTYWKITLAKINLWSICDAPSWKWWTSTFCRAIPRLIVLIHDQQPMNGLGLTLLSYMHVWYWCTWVKRYKYSNLS